MYVGPANVLDFFISVSSLLLSVHIRIPRHNCSKWVAMLPHMYYCSNTMGTLNLKHNHSGKTSGKPEDNRLSSHER